MAFTGAVTNGLGLTVKGFGALYLGGTNTFTGTATVNEGGILGVGVGGLNGISALSVGTTFTSGFNLFADSTGGTVSLPSNATVALGGAKSFARLGFQLGATAATSDSLALTGATSIMTAGAGGAVISVSPLATFNPPASSTTTFNLITTASGASISGASGFSLNASSLLTGYNYALTSTSSGVSLAVTAGAAGNLYWTGDVSGSWNAGAGTTNTNWSTQADGSADSQFAPNVSNTVNFSATNAGASAITTTLDQNFSVAGIDFLNSSTGAVTLSQGSFGALTIGSGGITFSASAPGATINAPIILGAAQTWTVGTGQTLNVQGGAPINGQVTGGYALTLSGAGTVTLGGYNTFSGGLTTSSTGTLNINNGGVSGASALGAGTVNITGGIIDNTSGHRHHRSADLEWQLHVHRI